MKGFLPIYYKGYRYELLIGKKDHYRIAGAGPCDLRLYQFEHELEVTILDGKLRTFYDGQELAGERITTVSSDVVFGGIQTSQRRVFDIGALKTLWIGEDDRTDLFFQKSGLDLLVERQEGGWRLQIFAGQVYRNNLAVKESDIYLTFGDELAFGKEKIKLFRDECQIWGDGIPGANLSRRWDSCYDLYPGFPDYHRSPRLMYQGSKEQFCITRPPQEVRPPSDELLKMMLPPIVMIGVTLLMAVFQPRGLYIIVTVLMSVMTTCLSGVNYVRNRKQYKKDVQERIDNYQYYLEAKARELRQQVEEYRKSQLYHYPSIDEIRKLTNRYDHRIYEKTSQQVDFLHYRLGLGTVQPPYSLRYDQIERSKESDHLEKAGYQLFRSYSQISQMPVVANLLHGPVGYVGPRKLVIEQLQLLVHQLATFHSYHEVQFIPIIPEEELGEWKWMRFLPHLTLEGMNVRGLVYNQRTRDQILNSLTQILKKRQAQALEAKNGQSPLFRPHYVVILTAEELVMDHMIMEFFKEDPTALGCSLIVVKDVLSSLAENVKTVISIRDVTTGELLMEEGHLREKRFNLDHFPAGFDKEQIVRRLAPLRHTENLKSSIPERVSFLELYGAKELSDLQIPDRWENHAPHKSLAVPIGWRGPGDVVELNLHEKAHGPHGLIAGTTGAGKSEVIQSYILSLAVNFHPHDVAFLLIDYKGGGMAHLFKDLPHLLGSITNLDGAQSMRALASIQAELRRRQRLFSMYEVNHINQYQKKYKLGQATEPLPHLFLISDEFAELKVNQPDFMKELVSTARIGRSLGIHLILATQKPSGVVDDQIWSNSRFKLALKVADRAGSQEMLKTPDAATITQAGRAYLQVGNNEVYELFQTAYSGADYQVEKDKLGIEDHSIYRINDLGQYEILGEDLSGLDQAEDIREVPTELDVIVAELRHLHRVAGIAALPQPWLPPLAERVHLEELDSISPVQEWQKKTSPKVLIGVADIPQEQKQETVEIDLSEEGNILLYGAPGTGKTTFLQTVAMDLARKLSPEELTLYLLDFGTNGLAPLSQLPHVADSILLEQSEKVQKFIRVIHQELDRRKKLLAEQGVGTLALYRQVTGEEEPVIVLLLDSYESMKDEPFENELFKLLMRISREGLSVGVHLVVTASRQNNLRAQLYSNFKHQLTLPQHDVAEIRSVVGASPLATSMEDIKGRALLKREDVHVLQLALPVLGDNDIDRINALRNQVRHLKQLWTGKTPEAIPMVPEKLTEEAFMTQYPSSQQALKKGEFPLGLEKETVQACSWNPKEGNLLYLYSKDDELVRMLDFMFHRIAEGSYKPAVVLPEMSFLTIDEKVARYDSAIQYVELLDALTRQMANRMQEGRTELTHIILWPNFEEVISKLNPDQQEQLRELLEKGPSVGYAHVILIRPSNLSKLSDPASRSVKTIQQALITVRIADQVIVSPSNRPVREAALASQENYWLTNHTIEKIMVPIG
ncbi:type VII secretion protein EssC [Streptococcus sp. DD13]|uniref:type VII secretion protein EssC n=1 Tax=Streptococcus sp. DD13 TaxID=1777881 RepID=UPI00079A1A12|nr:type VII secretion protein EssC [Streptococcus sp. DD13]KXT77716.1 FtsK/SpoIIIE family protein, putative secretion system component EssC/YukA [Streptococcus sp. DD13]